MAKNSVQVGRVLDLIAPAGGVVSGTAYLIGSIFVVALTSAAAGATFSGERLGGWTLPKAAVAISQGAKLYWDNTAFNLTTTAGGNTLVGAALSAALSGDASVNVLLTGQVS